MFICHHYYMACPIRPLFGKISSILSLLQYMYFESVFSVLSLYNYAIFFLLEEKWAFPININIPFWFFFIKLIYFLVFKGWGFILYNQSQSLEILCTCNPKTMKLNTQKLASEGIFFRFFFLHNVCLIFRA